MIVKQVVDQRFERKSVIGNVAEEGGRVDELRCQVLSAGVAPDVGHALKQILLAQCAGESNTARHGHEASATYGHHERRALNRCGGESVENSNGHGQKGVLCERSPDVGLHGRARVSRLDVGLHGRTGVSRGCSRSVWAWGSNLFSFGLSVICGNRRGTGPVGVFG